LKAVTENKAKQQEFDILRACVEGDGRKELKILLK